MLGLSLPEKKNIYPANQFKVAEGLFSTPNVTLWVFLKPTVPGTNWKWSSSPLSQLLFERIIQTHSSMLSPTLKENYSSHTPRPPRDEDTDRTCINAYAYTYTVPLLQKWQEKHSYSFKLLSPGSIPALSGVCSSLHHCSSRLLCLTVHSWHGWAHPGASLLRHARRIGGHTAHVSRKWSALHPSWWHSSQGHGTTRLAWPLSMHLTVGIYTHAGSWATVTCVGHAAVRRWSGVVTWTKW